MAFCYYFVFGRVFAFIHDFAPKSITPAPDIDAYFSFVITMFLAFGITFEIPIVVIVLVRMGIVTVEKLKEARPYVIVGAFVVAAVVTPPDVLSQFMLAVPMCTLCLSRRACSLSPRFVGDRGPKPASRNTRPQIRPAIEDPHHGRGQGASAQLAIRTSAPVKRGGGESGTRTPDKRIMIPLL